MSDEFFATGMDICADGVTTPKDVQLLGIVLCVIQGVQAYNLGVPILNEELCNRRVKHKKETER